MKTFLIISLIAFTAISCSSKKTAQYKEDKSPQFANSRQFDESPETVKRAAKAVLEELASESNPPAANAVREDGDSVNTGWVYGKSKDKFVEYNFNGAPRRKILSVRRKYDYNVSSSLAGTQVTVSIQEEIETVDLKTGNPTGWKNVAPDQKMVDHLVKLMREKIRSL